MAPNKSLKLPLAVAEVDRAAHLRSDESYLKSAWASASVLLFMDEKFVSNSNQINLLYEKSKKSKKETKEETTSITKKYNLGDKTDKDKFLDASKSVSDKNKINFDPTTDTATVGEGEVTEKSLSKKQQQFFGIVRGMQKGNTPKSGKAGQAAKEMTKKDVKDFASTKHKGLKNKVEDADKDVKYCIKVSSGWSIYGNIRLCI